MGGATQAISTSSEFFEEYSWLQEVFGLGAGIAGLLIFILAVIGQSLLIGLGVGFGAILLVIPGLIFAARWTMAPALLVATDKGITESMGDSWDSMRGNTTPIVLTMLIGFIFLAVIAGAVAVFSEGALPVQNSLVPAVLEQLISHVATVLSVSLGIFLFGRLYGFSTNLSDVFE